MDHNLLGAATDGSHHDLAAKDETRLLEHVLDSPEISSFLTELAIMTASCLSSKDNTIECGVTVVRDKGPAVAASTNARAAALDEIQNGFGDGPCLTAVHENSTTLIPDLLVEERRHRYAEAALGNGVRSILAVPLDLAGEAQGATNLYSRCPNGFTVRDILTAENFVATASRSLRLALTRASNSRNIKLPDVASAVVDSL